MPFKLLFHLQWTVSLLFGMIFTHSVSALTVDFSITPSNSGPAPLFVTLSVNNNSSLSPGFSISGYQWQVTGPETIQVPGRTGVVVELKRVGEYTIKLTMTEYALQKEEPKVVNGQTVIETFQVTRTDCATKRVVVYSQGSVPPSPTPVTDKGCQTSETRVSVGQEVVVVDTGDTGDNGDTGDTGDTGDIGDTGDTGNDNSAIGQLIGGGGQNNPTIEQPSEQPVSNFPLLGEALGAKFYGEVNNGGSLPNGSSFGSTEEVNVTVDLKVAPEHVGQQGDILVAVEYFLQGSQLGEFYFKTESTAFPFVRWNLETAMTPAQSSVILSDIHNIPVFSGHFQNLPGKYNIYCGYSLQNGAVFVHNYPTIPLTFTVTP
jgi:hypothetical protein